jgi:hypothetical protein
MNSHWQWGHPDDWSDAEWAHHQGRHERRRKRNENIRTVVYVTAFVIVVYWLGVGF